MSDPANHTLRLTVPASSIIRTVVPNIMWHQPRDPEIGDYGSPNLLSWAVPKVLFNRVFRDKHTLLLDLSEQIHDLEDNPVRKRSLNFFQTWTPNNSWSSNRSHTKSIILTSIRVPCKKGTPIKDIPGGGGIVSCWSRSHMRGTHLNFIVVHALLWD
jgi:hypothetical protein